MKKLINSLFVLAIAAMTFSSCEDVPAPYNMPQGATDSDDSASSSVDATGSGTVDDPYNVAAANEETAKLSSGESLGSTVYIKGIISQITEVDTLYGNATYYISDDGTTTNQFYVYRGYSLSNVKFTSEDEIQVGDTVVVCGELYNYYSTYELTQGNYIYSLNGSSVESSTETGEGSGTLSDPYNVAAANGEAAKLSSGESMGSSVYIKGIISQITEVDPSYGNATYYISDDGTTTNQFYVYRGYSLGNVKFTSEDEIKVGDEVIVYGEIINYYGTYELAQYNYIYSLNGATESSSTSEGNGTLDSPYSVATALDIINSGSYDSSAEVYVKGIISEIESVSTSYGNATYYISDDGTTTNQLYIYRGYSLNGDKFTSEDEILVGDEVVILGKLTQYYSTPEVTTGSQIVSLTHNSSSESTATISKDGTIVTITDASATASSSSVTCTLNTYGWDNAADPEVVTLSDGTTITFAQEGGNNAPKYYDGTNGVRMYALNSMTIVGSKKIAKVVLTCDSSTTVEYVGNDEMYTTISGNTWKVVNDLSTGNSGGTQLRVQVIEITYAE